MRDGWFDGQGVDILNSDSARESATFKKYFEDEYISTNEFKEQETKLRGMLTSIEGGLDDSTHGSMSAALLEFSVLVEMYKVALAISAKEGGEEAENEGGD